MSPITTKAQAEAAIDDLTVLIGQLSDLVAQETTLLHAGQVRGAAEIEPTKRQLAGRLYTASERIKANAKFVMQTAPVRCAALKTAQEALRALLQKNMIVLATAHAVTEGIVRRLSGELAKKASPQVYGASGRTIAPNPRNGRPLAISRTL
jgi:flagellar biosynthesis/type III secretory pathway chaperone